MEPRFGQAQADTTQMFPRQEVNPAIVKSSELFTPKPVFSQPQTVQAPMFGPVEDPLKKTVESIQQDLAAPITNSPVARFGKLVTKGKEIVEDMLNKEDADLARPAPLSVWAKDLGTILAKVPFRVARFGAQGVDYAVDAVNPIPESYFKVSKMEDDVMKVAAMVGLPLDDAKQVVTKQPALLQSLHDSFVKPVKEGFQVHAMKDGPEKESALALWAYRSTQAFLGGLTAGVTDELLQNNSVSFQGGEVFYRGIPIGELSEMEAKAVGAGGLTGSVVGSMALYGVVSPMLTSALRSVPALDKVYKTHPFLSSAIMTNAAEEGFEAVVRKSTGQTYTFNDTLVGLMSGLAFETGKVSLGGYKGEFEQARIEKAVDSSPALQAVRGFLNAEIRSYVVENGHIPSSNDLRARIGETVIPGMTMTINQVHGILANSGIKEARLIEMSGGKRGTPGMDYPTEPPKVPETEVDGDISSIQSQIQNRTARKTGGQVEQVFRTDKFNVDEAGQQRLSLSQESLGMETRDVRSWKEVEELAAVLGMDPNQLLRRVGNKSQLSDVEVEALRQNTQAAHEFLSKQHEMIDAATNLGDMKAVDDIQNKVKMYERIIDNSVAKLLGAGTELGRGVAIYRKIAAMKMDDPTFFYKEAMKLLKDNRRKVRFNGQEVAVSKVDGKPSLPPKLREAIDTLMKNKDSLGIAYLFAQLRKTNNVDQVIQLWKAGLLTSPTTDAANILGNTSLMLLEAAKDIPATLADMAIAASAKTSNFLLGTKFSTDRVKTIHLSMLKKQLLGMYQGGKSAGFTELPKAAFVNTRAAAAKSSNRIFGTKFNTSGYDGKGFLFTGLDPNNAMDKWDVKPQTNIDIFPSSKANTLAQSYLDTVFNRLGAEDMVFRQSFLNKSLQESALLRYKNMSISERRAAMEALPEGMPRTKQALVEFFYQRPTPEAEARAIDVAETGTFQRDNALATSISNAKRDAPPVLRATYEVIAPFTKTPTNVALSLYEYTPVGFVHELAKQLVLRDPSKLKLVESLGRSVTGTSVMALGSMLNEAGMLTGNPPESESERKMWELQKKTANSILINGEWLRLDKIAPIGLLLSLGAAWNELGKTNLRSGQIAKMGFAAAKSITQLSFLQGVSKFTAAITEPDKFGESAIENLFRGIVPNIIGRVSSGMDEYERDTGSFDITFPLRVIQSRIPILRESLPVKLNMLGRAVGTDGGVLKYLLDPFSSKTATKDPIVKELVRLGITIPQPNQSLYSDEEYRNMIQIRGEVLSSIATNLLSGNSDDNVAQEDVDKFLTVQDEGKKIIMNSIVDSTTRVTHDIMRPIAAERLYKEVMTLPESDRAKRLEQIEKKNETIYKLISDKINATN